MTGDDDTGEKVFGFADLQALRDEYEERLATQKRDYEAKLKSDADARGELIHELTFELASVHEESARSSKIADARLGHVLGELQRLEMEIARLKDSVALALMPAGPAPSRAAPPAAAPSSPPVVDAAPLVVASAPAPAAPPSGPSASLAAFAPAKRKKIRLR